MSTTMRSKVAVVVGSDADLGIVDKGIQMLHSFEIATDIKVFALDKSVEELVAFAQRAKTFGYAILVIASAQFPHLAGLIAACTPVPVIAIPLQSNFDGLDALLSIAQMSKENPVATVAIDCAENAAILCAQILAIANTFYRDKLKDYKANLIQKVEEKNAALQQSLKDI